MSVIILNMQKWHIVFLLTIVLFSYQVWLLTARPQIFSHQARPTFSATVPVAAGVQVRRNIWADITDQEARELFVWLHGDTAGLNVTAADEATSNDDDFIYVTEILRPNKTDAIAFLDEGTVQPARYCRVSVKRNSIEPPQIEEYTVGPLPLGTDTRVDPLTFTYNSGRSATRNPTPDATKLLRWLEEVAADVADIIQDLLGSSGLGHLTAMDFEPGSNDQVWMEDGRIMRWVTFFQRSSAKTMLPQALYFKADTTGRDPRNWRVVTWLYAGKIYTSTQAFREAWLAPDFERLPPNVDGDWTKLEPEPIPESESYSKGTSPSMHQQGSSRVFVDTDESYVSWMGFNFNMAFSQVNGLSIYDIRLDGERIIYELSMQEAMAHYAGDNPVQSGTAYLDSYYGLGTTLSELIPGYDCPEYAHFMDTMYHRMEKSYRRSGAICIFESPLDYPLQRHSRGSRITSYTNSVLIVRTIAVIANYDYLVDYIFYLDGSIEVKVRASGYIQGAFAWNNSDYGYRIHEQFSSSIHDHVINFKADLDIGGTKNNFSVMTVAAQNVSYPWSTTGPRSTMVLHRSQIDNEDAAALDWPPNGASMYVIAGESNIYGEKRGYRIMPGTGVGSPVHLTPSYSSNLLNAADWARHDIFVTRQKDTEPRSASPANILTPEDPLIRFDKFLDGESLVDEDLVVWFNLGNHHVPHTGDIPNTLMTTSASSVMLSPHNYHLHDRSRALTNGVTVSFKSDSSADAYYFGATNGSLANFTGSPKPLRKFPSNDTELSL